MWVRKRLDIGWSDLAFGAATSLLPAACAAVRRRPERPALANGHTLICLSVRSGFDLLLGALDLPAGSEVLMSALTIPDMVRIVQRHGLVAVPVDLEPATMAPPVDSLARSATARARMVVVAHLFGSRVPMEPIVQFARARGLMCVEDCAQAFDGVHWGHPEADASLFSFGPIKTATALGGGSLRLRDTALFERIEACQAVWPTQGRATYFRRTAKYACLKVASCRPVLSAWVTACEATGRDFDRLANSAARGFAGADFFGRIRRRPSAPLLSMIKRRLANFDGRRLARRIALGRQLAGLLSERVPCPAAHTSPHTYWVFPILVANPAEVIVGLRRSGFDATQGASMFVVPPPTGRPEVRALVAEAAFSAMVYLPFYPEMPEAAVHEMAGVVLRIAKPATMPRGGMLEIPNPKHEIPNTSQIPIPKAPNETHGSLDASHSP